MARALAAWCMPYCTSLVADHSAVPRSGGETTCGLRLLQIFRVCVRLVCVMCRDNISVLYVYTVKPLGLGAVFAVCEN